MPRRVDVLEARSVEGIERGLSQDLAPVGAAGEDPGHRLDLGRGHPGEEHDPHQSHGGREIVDRPVIPGLLRLEGLQTEEGLPQPLALPLLERLPVQPGTQLVGQPVVALTMGHRHQHAPVLQLPDREPDVFLGIDAAVRLLRPRQAQQVVDRRPRPVGPEQRHGPGDVLSPVRGLARVPNAGGDGRLRGVAVSHGLLAASAWAHYKPAFRCPLLSRTGR